MKGIHDIRLTHKGAVFSLVTVEMNNILTFMTDFAVEKLECTPPTLEELFMSHYEGSRG
jgi:ABC-2 type transport system ATP-binding protein